MDKDDLARILDGRTYTEEITSEEGAQAKACGLIVIFGGSDDLMELRGAIYDEVDAYDGAVLALDASGYILPTIDDDELEVLEKHNVFDTVKDNYAAVVSYFKLKRRLRNYSLNASSHVGRLPISFKDHYKFASRTSQSERSVDLLRLLQERFLTIGETFAAKLMSMLKIIHNALVYICKHSVGNFPNFILLFLCTPVFKAHTFGFKFAIFCFKRRRALLHSHSVVLSGDNSALQFHNLFIEFDRIANAEHGIRDIVNSLKACKQRNRF